MMHYRFHYPLQHPQSGGAPSGTPGAANPGQTPRLDALEGQFITLSGGVSDLQTDVAFLKTDVAG